MQLYFVSVYTRVFVLNVKKHNVFVYVFKYESLLHIIPGCMLMYISDVLVELLAGVKLPAYRSLSQVVYS